MTNAKPFSLVLLALLCFAMTSSATAQQPFEGLPEAKQDSPRPNTQDDQGVLPQDPPIRIRPRGDRLPLGSQTNPQDREQVSDQSVLLNAKYAGWQGAEMAGAQKQVGEGIRRNWIMVDPNGLFEGQVFPGKDADVRNMNVFLMNKGRLVKQTTVDSAGRFSFNNVRQGSYALICWGDRGLFVFGMNILAHNAEAVGNRPPNTVKVTAFQNRTSINTDWIRFYAARVGFRIYGRHPSGEGRDDPASLYGFLGLFNQAPESTPATSLSSHNVAKTADGRLVGRVHQFSSIDGRPVDVRSTKVMLMENDSVVASTTTDNYGLFEFQQVPDGSYGVLAAGVDGVGLIAINVGSASAQMNDQGEMLNTASTIDFTMVSSETIGWLNHYAGEVAYRRNLMAPRQRTLDAQPGMGCAVCNNQGGGCSACQAEYMKSFCRSRGLTFEQWQMYCQGTRSGFGDGSFVRESGNRLRTFIDKVDAFYERTFYPDDGAALRGLQQQPGVGQNYFQPNYEQPYMGQQIIGQPYMGQPYMGQQIIGQPIQDVAPAIAPGGAIAPAAGALPPAPSF